MSVQSTQKSACLEVRVSLSRSCRGHVESGWDEEGKEKGEINKAKVGSCSEILDRRLLSR